jgi:hypothetical protein
MSEKTISRYCPFKSCKLLLESSEHCLRYLYTWAMILSDRMTSRMSEGSSGRLLEGDEAAVTMLDVLQDEQELEDDANVRGDFILCSIKGIVSRDIGYTF